MVKRRVIVEEYNHWSEIQKETKRKDRWDIIVLAVCIIAGGIATWMI